MKITIITGYFHPEITAETHLLLDLATDLKKLGADVSVVTSFPSRGIDDLTRKKYSRIDREVWVNGIEVLRGGLKATEGKGFIGRTLHYLILSYALYRIARRINPDVFLITSTPPFLGAAGIFLSKVAPTVYNLQDLFPESLVLARKNSKYSPVINMLKRIEKSIYRYNTHILTVSNDFKNKIITKGVPEKKVSIVYNWIDTDAVIPVDRSENELISRYGLDAKCFFVTYCGNIGYSQNLEMVVDVAKRIEHRFPDIKFIFIGDGAWSSELKNYIDKVGTSNVRLLPYQPYSKISSVFSLGDISLVCSKKGASFCSMPSKTWSIMSAEKAVLSSFDTDSELCSIIRRADSGICVPPENDSEFERELILMYSDRERTRQFGINGRKYVKNNLSRERSTSEYYSILKHTAAKSVRSIADRRIKHGEHHEKNF